MPHHVSSFALLIALRGANLAAAILRSSSKASLCIVASNDLWNAEYAYTGHCQ